ncbi:Uncharacterised protein [Bordetella pertussis]|nr:Uncharacterised protein [Bordetella pertussis]
MLWARPVRSASAATVSGASSRARVASTYSTRSAPPAMACSCMSIVP